MDSSSPTLRHDLAVRMAELARMIVAPRTLEQILNDVTATAVELIPGADVSGILLVKKGGDFDSLADTAGLAAELDRLQHDFGEGPCAEAALQETVVRSDDLRTESRWPRYAPAAVALGVLSGLSFKLYTADRTAGAPRRTDASGVIDQRPDWSGQRHHHGTLWRRRCARLRDAAGAITRESNEACCRCPTRHRDLQRRQQLNPSAARTVSVNCQHAGRCGWTTCPESY